MKVLDFKLMGFFNFSFMGGILLMIFVFDVSKTIYAQEINKLSSGVHLEEFTSPQKQLLFHIERNDYIRIAELIRTTQFEPNFVNTHAAEAFIKSARMLSDALFLAKYESYDIRELEKLSWWQTTISDEEEDLLTPLVHYHFETLKLLLNMGLDTSWNKSTPFNEPLYGYLIDEFYGWYSDYGVVNKTKFNEITTAFIDAGIDLVIQFEDKHPIYRLRGGQELLYPEFAKQLIQKQLHIDLDIGDGNTLLMLAASENQVSVVQELLANGASVWAENNNEKMALELAGSNVFTVRIPPEGITTMRLIFQKMAEKLLKSTGSQANANHLFWLHEFSHPLPMFLVACFLDDVKTMEQLLALNVDPNKIKYVVEGEERTNYPAIFAARNGRSDAFEVLLSSTRFSPNIVDEQGRNLVHAALIGKSEEILQHVINVAPDLLNKPDSNNILPAEYFFELDDETMLSLGPIFFQPPFNPNIIINKDLQLRNRLFRVSFTPLGKIIKGDVFDQESSNKNKPLVEALLKLPNINVNYANDNGVTPLMLAAAHNTHELFQILIENYSAKYLLPTDEDNKNVLFYLATAVPAKPQSVRYLLEAIPEPDRKAFINKEDHVGETALFKLIRNQKDWTGDNFHLQIEFMHILVKYGANVRVFNVNGNSLTMLALQNGSLEKLKSLAGLGAPFSKYKINVDGLHPLSDAISRFTTGQLSLEHIEVVLRQNNYTVDEIDAEITDKPAIIRDKIKLLYKKIAEEKSLMWALSQDNFDKAKRLLESGASVNARFEYGRTLLMEMMIRKNENAAHFIFEQPDFDLLRTDYRNDSHLAYATSMKNPGLLSTIKSLLVKQFFIAIQEKQLKKLPLYLEQGLDINEVQDKQGNTPLMAAMQLDDLAVFYHLLKRKELKVSQKNKQGESLSNFAFNYGNDEVLEALKNRFPKSAYLFSSHFVSQQKLHKRWFQQVKEGNVEEVKQMLGNKQLDIRVKNDRGETAFDIAFKKANNDIVDLLAKELEFTFTLKAWYLHIHAYKFTVLVIFAMMILILIVHRVVGRLINQLRGKNNVARKHVIIRLSYLLMTSKVASKFSVVPVISYVAKFIEQLCHSDEIKKVLEELKTDSDFEIRVLAFQCLDGFRSAKMISKKMQSSNRGITVRVNEQWQSGDEAGIGFSVCSKQNLLTIEEFGLLIFIANRWVLADSEGRSFDVNEFEKIFDCPNGKLIPAQLYHYSASSVMDISQIGQDVMFYCFARDEHGKIWNGQQKLRP